MRNRRTITRSLITGIVVAAASLVTAGAFAQDSNVSPFVPIDMDTYQASQPSSAQTNASDTIEEGETTGTEGGVNDTARFREGVNPFVQLSIK